MKRLNQRRKNWHLHRARTEAIKKAKKRGQGAQRLRKKARSGPMPPEVFEKYRSRIKRLVPPKTFCFEDNYDETANFIGDVRTNLLNPSESDKKRYMGMYVDFREIEEISSSAALVLAAEYDRRRRLSGRPMSPVDIEEWNDDVRVKLFELGFLNVLGIKDPLTSFEEVPERKQKIIPFVSGVKTQGEQAYEMGQTLRKIFSFLREEDWMVFYESVTEAMNNVVSHAYPEKTTWTYPPVNRWWMTGSVDQAKNEMTVVFYDQGVTIPLSLPRSRIYELVKETMLRLHNALPGTLDRVDDAERIHAAMEVSRTSTGKSERGLGLGQIRGFVDDCRKGRLRIISRHGHYSYDPQRGVSLRNSPISIGGTLIEWTVRRL